MTKKDIVKDLELALKRQSDTCAKRDINYFKFNLNLICNLNASSLYL